MSEPPEHDRGFAATHLQARTVRSVELTGTKFVAWPQAMYLAAHHLSLLDPAAHAASRSGRSFSCLTLMNVGFREGAVGGAAGL
jgi:hypothetical protein